MPYYKVGFTTPWPGCDEEETAMFFDTEEEAEEYARGMAENVAAEICGYSEIDNDVCQECGTELDDDECPECDRDYCEDCGDELYNGECQFCAEQEEYEDD